MSEESLYSVTFVFDYTTVSTTVSVTHEDAAEELAIYLIHTDLLIPRALLERANDVVVETLDRSVL